MTLLYKTMASAATVLGLCSVNAFAGSGTLPSSPRHSFAPRLIAQAQSNKISSAAKAAQAARQLARDERTLPAEAAPFEDGTALVLNLKPVFRSNFATLSSDHARYVNFLGRQVIDGVPLHIEGDVVLYGRTLVDQGKGETRNVPRLIRGVRVGRPFAELHLLHEAAWRDLEGTPIAIITLRYHDGTTADLPIVYGAHLRDGMRLLTEKIESLTDPASKIVWRGPGPGSEELHGQYRLFKTTLRNPDPDKMVDTIDLKSAGEPLASYKLIAATVTPFGPNRPVTPPLPAELPRSFDGRLVVHVVDASTHQPLADATISPALKVDGIFLIGDVLRTSSEGNATILFPTAATTRMSIRASKGGAFSKSVEWNPAMMDVTLE